MEIAAKNRRWKQEVDPVKARALATVVVSVLLALMVGSVFAHESSENDHTLDNACVSFDGYYGAVKVSNDPSFGSVVDVNGVLFRGKGRISDEGKLLFAKAVIEIVLPRPAASVNLEIFEDGYPITIEAFDGAGSLLETIQTNRRQTMGAAVGLFHLSRSGFAISRLELSSEGGEGGIGFVCALMEGK